MERVKNISEREPKIVRTIGSDESKAGKNVRKLFRNAISGEIVDLNPPKTSKSKFEKTALLAKGSVTKISDRSAKNRIVTTSPSDSDLLLEAKRIFGTSVKATHWLNYPRYQFDGKSPLEMASTKKGRLAVQEMLGQIEHGMFS
jgi:Protein of unknown function (DUF2384)